MAYVSARYAPPDPLLPEPREGQRRVIATDENGVEWHLTEDSLVGDWLEYIANGGGIDPADAAPKTTP